MSRGEFQEKNLSTERIRNELAQLAARIAKGEIQPNGLDVEQALHRLKAETKLSLAVLRREFKALYQEASNQKSQAKPIPQADLDAADRLLQSPNLFQKWQEDFALTGYLAGANLAVIGLMWLLRAHLCVSSALYAFGKSAGGKTEFLAKVVGFFPADRVITLTKITPKYLYRAGGQDGCAFKGKILLCGEMNPVKPGEDDPIQEAVRQLVSDNKLELGSVDDIGGQSNVAIKHVIYGPVSIGFTGTRSPFDWDDQMINRSYCVHVKHTQQSIKGVLANKASSGTISSNPFAISGDELATRQRAWQAAFSQLKRHDPEDPDQFYGIEIPFLQQLIFRKKRLTEPDMRAFEMLKSSIAVSALLHQRTRTKKPKDGKIVLIADWQDYLNVKDAFLDTVPRTSQGLSNDLIEIFTKLLLPWWKQPLNEGRKRTVAEIAAALDTPDKTARRWIYSWLAADLLEVDESTGGDAKDRKKYYRLTSDCELLASAIRDRGDLNIDEGVSLGIEREVISGELSLGNGEPSNFSQQTMRSTEKDVRTHVAQNTLQPSCDDFSPPLTTSQIQSQEVRTQDYQSVPEHGSGFSPENREHTNARKIAEGNSEVIEI